MHGSFQNKVALVTGAGSGMGLATAKAFAEAGAAVALIDIHADALAAADDLIAAGHRGRLRPSSSGSSTVDGSPPCCSQE